MEFTPDQQAGVDTATAYCARLTSACAYENELLHLLADLCAKNPTQVGGFLASIDAHLRGWAGSVAAIKPWQESVAASVAAAQTEMGAALKQSFVNGELAAYRTLISSRPAQL